MTQSCPVFTASSEPIRDRYSINIIQNGKLTLTEATCLDRSKIGYETSRRAEMGLLGPRRLLRGLGGIYPNARPLYIIPHVTPNR